MLNQKHMLKRKVVNFSGKVEGKGEGKLIEPIPGIFKEKLSDKITN